MKTGLLISAAILSFALPFAAAVGGDIKYTYDALGRLVGTEYVGDTKELKYKYDVLGNITKKEIAAAGSGVPPVAVDDKKYCPEDDACYIDVLANDSDPDDTTPPLNDLLFVANVTPVADGYVFITPTSIGYYSPDRWFKGDVTYTVEDPDGLTDTGLLEYCVQSPKGSYCNGYPP